MKVNDDIDSLLNFIDTAAKEEPVTTVDINKKIMLSKSKEAIGEKPRDPSEVDLTETEFPKVSKIFADKKHTLFDTTNFYKNIFSEGGESAERLHNSLSKYLTSEDSGEKTIYRQQIIVDYWNFVADLSIDIGAGIASREKKYAMRFGMILPTLLMPNQKDAFAKVIDENKYCVPIYYLDEWFENIGDGTITPSATDEVQVRKRNDNERFKQLYDKAEGRKQSSESLMLAKSNERSRLEDDLKEHLEVAFTHEFVTGLQAGIKAPYTENQKRDISSINNKVRNILSADRELTSLINDYRRAIDDMKSLDKKIVKGDDAETNFSNVEQECNTVRQMAKMTCGRRGNHFPVLSREYLRSLPQEIGFRENVLKVLTTVESIDPQVFCRQYKSQLNRIPPFIILIPSYGEIGFCWEPYDRYNRVTSRGRIALPMYAKSITVSILRALADLRWQVAKEKASYYWMEEGLTGHYYQWYQNQKLKGDVKSYFINDYVIWISKESEGIQKLDKEVRDIFWRHMPFSQHIKDILRKRAPVYEELYTRDLRKQLSDGY